MLKYSVSLDRISNRLQFHNFSMYNMYDDTSFYFDLFTLRLLVVRIVGKKIDSHRHYKLYDVY